MAQLLNTVLFSDANLVSYYKLENTSDSKGSNTLTNTGATPFNAAKYGNGADGGASNTTKYLSVANKLSYANGAYSIVMWVKLQTEITSGTYRFCEIQDSVSKTSFALNYNYNGGTLQLEGFHLRAGVASENAQYTTTLGTSIFHHIALVNNATNILLYLDGAQVATIGFNSGVGSSALTDGMELLCDRVNSNLASAIFDDVGFFTRALTINEIKTLYLPASGLLAFDI